MITLLVIVPLLSLAAVPIVRHRFRPSPALSALLAAPWRAALLLILANGIILGPTVLVFRHGPTGLPLAVGILAASASIACWTTFGMALPLTGGSRWAVALLGHLPYYVLTAAVWLWLGQAEAVVDPTADLFMAWIGAMLVTIVSAGATAIGTALIGPAGAR